MKKPSIKRVAYQYLKKQAGEVHIEHEGGDPSPKHKKLKEKIDRGSTSGAGSKGIQLKSGDKIKAKKDTIVEFRIGAIGFVTKGTILEADFGTALGKANCIIVSGNAYSWKYGTKITHYRGAGIPIAPKRERGEIVGVLKRTGKVELSYNGGYSSVGPYALGKVDPKLWEIL